MGTRLFVGGLSFNTDDAGLRAAFEAHGEVVEAKVILDRETGRSRGFGFVNFADEGSAQSAIQAMNGAFLDGRTIRVNEAQERGGGGGGGGPRGRGPRSSGGPRSGPGGGYRGGPGGGRGGPPGRSGGGYRGGPGGGPQVVTRGRAPGGPGGPGGPRGGPRPPMPPQIPDGPPPPFENEFDDRKRRDFSKKQREKKERDPERAPQRAPRKPNRRASGRSWRDYDVEEDEG